MDSLFIVRRATINDADTLAAFARRTFHEAFADTAPPEMMAQYLDDSFNPAQVAADLSDPLSVFFVAIDKSDGFAGYVRVHFGNPLPEVQGSDPVKLWRLYTACEWQGKGVGKALLSEAVRIAQERGGKTLWLTVNHENHNAVAFYKRNGFQQTGFTTFNLGGTIHKDFVMELPLTPLPPLSSQ